MTPITSNIQYLAHILHYFSVIAGIVMISAALFKIKRYGEARTQMSIQHTLGPPLIMLAVGATLCSIGTVMTVFTGIFWGAGFDSNSSLVQYSALMPIVMFIRLLGVGAFIRGCFSLAKYHADQQGAVGKGLTYIISGCLLMHIVKLSHVVWQGFFSGV